MVVMFPQLLVSVPSAFRRVSKCGPHCFRDAPFGPVVFIILTIPRKHTLQKPPWKKDTRCIKKEMPLRLGLVQSLFHSTGWRIKKKDGLFLGKWLSGSGAHTLPFTTSYLHIHEIHESMSCLVREHIKKRTNFYIWIKRLFEFKLKISASQYHWATMLMLFTGPQKISIS